MGLETTTLDMLLNSRNELKPRYDKEQRQSLTVMVASFFLATKLDMNKITIMQKGDMKNTRLDPVICHKIQDLTPSFYVPAVLGICTKKRGD